MITIHPSAVCVFQPCFLLERSYEFAAIFGPVFREAPLLSTPGLVGVRYAVQRDANHGLDHRLDLCPTAKPFQVQGQDDLGSQERHNHHSNQLPGLSWGLAQLVRSYLPLAFHSPLLYMLLLQEAVNRLDAKDGTRALYNEAPQRAKKTKLSLKIRNLSWQHASKVEKEVA